MKRSWLVHVDDMLNAAVRLARLVSSMPAEELHVSEDVSDALLYNLIVLGKGVEHIPADTRNRYPDIDWDGLAESANTALRDYQTLDMAALWQTTAARLPALAYTLVHICVSADGTQAAAPIRTTSATHRPTPRREHVLSTLQRHQHELPALRVRHLRLFGSVARDDAGPESDVDLLVEFSEPVGYFHVFHVQERLAALLGYPVDLVPEGGLKPRIRERVLREAIPVA